MNAKRPDSAAKPSKTSAKPSGSAGTESEGGERIAKRLARAGLCSRRDAERWIAEGRVAVNGTVLTSPACVVRAGDAVLVDGNPIPEPEPARLWRYHKPSGLVTTARDEKGRETVFEKLPAELPRVVSVGRLDLTTEGLLLLTNDGELARFLELPTTGWTRRYRVRVFGEVDENQLAKLEKGLTIDGVQYGPIEAALDRIQGRNAWLTVALKEGKNREIRKVMETLGLQVNRLIRVAYGPFQLGKLEEGAVEEVPRRVVREQLARFFADREDEEVKAPSKTQQRARARAEGTAPPVSKPPAAAPAKAVDQPAATRRAPRTAAQRQEAQAAWGKEEPADNRRRGAGKAAPARGTPAAPVKGAPAKGVAAKGADGAPPRRRETRAEAKAAPGNPVPAKSGPAARGGASAKPAGGPSRPGGQKPAAPKSAGPKSAAPKSAAPKSGVPKPGSAKPGTPKSGAPKPGASRTGGPRADRRR